MDLKLLLAVLEFSFCGCKACFRITPRKSIIKPIRVRKIQLCLIPFVVLLSCGHPPPGRGAGEVEASQSSQSSFKVETVIPNLEIVWSIVWAPDGRMLFTERPGRERVFENGKLRPEPLFVVPDVEPRGESGLMSIALHPQFAANHFLYLSYAYN